MRAIFPFLALFLSLSIPAAAEQFGLFTYVVSGGEVTITNYPDDAVGHVEIPAEIEGLPVTQIGGPITQWGWNRAFSGCTELNPFPPRADGDWRRWRQEANSFQFQ
jgi:hypothetical protein